MKKLIVPLIAITLPLLAASPQFWEIRTFDDFKRGKLTNLSLTSEDELVLAPRMDMLFATGQPIVFSAASDSKGNTYIGTGHDGRVYRLDPDGKGSLWADLPELDVLALAVDSTDRLFAATSPDGKVYRIATEGKPEEFFKPAAKYIWSMTFDRTGRLYVATGDQGVIYRVSADGKSETFYDTDETHVISTVLDREGNLIAGGDPKGYIYRISPEGKGFVLYDSGLREVHDLAIGPNGSIYAAVLGSRPSFSVPAPASSQPATGTGGEPTVTVTVGTMAQTVDVIETIDATPVAVSRNEPRRSPDAGAQSVIIEVLADGTVNTLWRSRDEMVFSLLPRPGRLLFSTGSKGRIYAWNGPRSVTLLAESTEEQTTRLVGAANRVLAVTANAGKVFGLSDSIATSGSYESIVRDTEAVSSWGRLSWRSREPQGIEFFIRSGNTGTPDKTWSDWLPVPATGVSGAPRARFVQWKASFKADGQRSPGLSSLTLPYLQQNFRPELTSIEALNPGISLIKVQTFQTGNVTPGTDSNGNRIGGPRQNASAPKIPPRRQNQKGAQSFQWTASDRNGDVLTYDLYYRGDSERSWKPLKKGLEENFYTIESDTLPDGSYVLKVVASDDSSNPEAAVLQGEIESRPFMIDNTPPQVSVRLVGVEQGRARIAIETTDLTSTLNQAEVSVDTGTWRTVFPRDGIVDSRDESFEWLSGTLPAGEHVIAFRVYDQNDNVGIGKVVVRIP